MQALALDVRVMNQNGEEIELSTLCNDDEPARYRQKTPRTTAADFEDDDDTIDAHVDEVMGDYAETDELDAGYLVEHDELYDVPEMDGDDAYGDED